ncbi:hypothetical protein AB1Y20_007891 [Prymnesium parvum]|uniref:Protein kinase domain-containing protein n=1 Tax=Prymnesium parvum TaxID=97485 RepID=A0AB34IU12_PRYPA
MAQGALLRLLLLCGARPMRSWRSSPSSHFHQRLTLRASMAASYPSRALADTEPAASLATSEAADGVASDRLLRARSRLQQALDEAKGVSKPSAEQWTPKPPYDPEVAAQRFKRNGDAVMRRQAQLLGPVFGFLSRVVLDYQAGNEEKHRQKRAVELREVISSLGPAIIKAGQALSSRSDLLPAEYLAELSKLQDQIPPFPTAEAFRIIEEELGRPLNESYAAIDEAPMAAASLGQVYQATLLDGTKVAIKVQRPGAEPTIALDLYILRSYSATLTWLISLLGRQIDLVSVIDDFGELIYSEIDYAIEAASARRFVSLYGSIANVTAPKVYTALSTRKVLTMEWIDGVRLTDREALLRQGLDPSRLVDTLTQCTLRQILQNGFFHADPHGGNLLVDKAGRLVYIDFGMMSFVAPSQRYAIIEAVVHMVNRDFRALAQLYKELGFIPADESIEPIATALNEALPNVLNSSVAEFNFKSVIDKLGDVMYTYPFSLPPFYIAVIRCLGVLEGVAMQVDQDFAIIKDAYPFVATRLLTDRAPQLQNALQQLIFKDGQVRWTYFEDLFENALQNPDYDLVTAAEQESGLSDYLLSDEGAPLLEALSESLVDELDTLSADTVAYLFNSTLSLARQLLLSSPGNASTLATGADIAGNIPPPASEASEAFVRAALTSLSDTIASLSSGEWEAAVQSVEELTDEQMSPTMRRTVRWLGYLRESSVAGADLSRVGVLLGSLLTQQRFQQQLADVSLQLFERGLLRGIRSLFGVRMSDETGDRPGKRSTQY